MSRGRAMGYKKPKDTKKTLRILIHYLGFHRWTVLLVSILVITSSLANVLGTYMLKPLVNDYIIPMDIPGLIRGLIVLGIIYAVGALSTLGYNQLMVGVAQKVIARIRKDLFAHVQTLPLSFFDGMTHGELMSYFTNDVDTISDALNNSFTLLIQSLTVTTGTLLMIIVLNWQLSIVVFVSLGFMLIYVNYNSRKSRINFREQQKNMANLNGYIEEIISGQKVSRVFNHEQQDFEKFTELSANLRDASARAQTYAGRLVPVIVSISYINYSLSAAIGGLFAISGLMSVGSLTAYLVYVRQSAMPLNQFSQQINFILIALAGAERIFSIMEIEPESDQGKTVLEATGKESWMWKSSTVNTPLQGKVVFDHVSFGYQSNRYVLEDISLFAKPGQKVALVGSTGAGKTTIINLITRFYEINAGTIFYDGIPLTDIQKDSLRHSLGMVNQDTHLFSGTIMDNIRYGKLDASDEEVIEAAKLANADSFIRRLPQGYHTALSNDGANLSQGQRQLLSIARTALADPPVLILDEATSSIDTRTEKLIERGMDRLMNNRTVFVIAHRLSTVRNSDAILVLEHGHIIERGSHEELLQQKGRYYQLYYGLSELS